jgi:hypothetical protein
MGEPENLPADHDASDCQGADPPLTADVLADLQAGLLDDGAAARVRRQVRADPEAQRILRALNQVRRDIAAAGADPATGFEAAEVPPEVPARGGAHLARPRVRPARVFAGAAGLCAAVAAVGMGTFALVNAPAPAPSTPVTAEHITVSTPLTTIPLSRDQILALLDRAPEYGPFADTSRRASCLSGLGYPASARVLGAEPIEINAHPGVLLVLPADAPKTLAVFAVALNCSAADTGLLANSEIAGP